MSLDLHATADQIQSLARQLQGRRDQHLQGLGRALDVLRRADPKAINTKADASLTRLFFRPAGLGEAPGKSYSPPPCPDDFCVAAVDGSHIDVDRHLPVRCYLINIGGCLLTYGSAPDALLFSRPSLYTNDEDLHLQDPASGVNEVPVEGDLLGLKRTVEELKALAQVVERVPKGMPVLALVDGSLVLWELAGEGRRYPPFVRDTLLKTGLLPALDALHRASQERPVALAAYISLPGSSEVVNALRIERCPYNPFANCNHFCRDKRPGGRPCDDPLHGLTDRDLFALALAPGERSDLFFTRSSVVREHYRPHQVSFFYLNVGPELARAEVPEWVAQDDKLLALTHALVLDQCRRGLGYPAAIAEAHEQAVVTAADRAEFRHLVEEALQEHRLPVYTSEKRKSKRQRWV